jgi:cell division protein FtsB
LQDLTDEFAAPSDTIWRKLNLLFSAMIAVVVGVTLLYKALPATRDKEAQDRHIAELQKAIAEAEMTNQRRTREVEALQRDPEYAGIIARDKLGLMKDGETILRLEKK